MPDYYNGAGGMQPFDVIDAFGLDFYEGNVIKYVCRWRKKNGLEDLYKARRYIDEVIRRAAAPGPEAVVLPETALLYTAAPCDGTDPERGVRLIRGGQVLNRLSHREACELAFDLLDASGRSAEQRDTAIPAATDLQES